MTDKKNVKRFTDDPDLFAVDPAVPNDEPIQPLMSPFEPRTHPSGKDGMWVAQNSTAAGETVRMEFVTTDAAVYNAEQLLSSMETWADAPEDHRAETPKRFVAMLREMTTKDPEFKFTTFDHEGPSEMITLGPIPFYTLCAHHVVPFFGNAWIGYVPDKSIAGLSKFPRAVKHLAKGFWVQETLTTEIADFLEDKLDPLGVAVVLEAEHMCMAMRGIEVAGVTTRTAAMRGVFSDHSRTAKSEFLDGIKR